MKKRNDRGVDTTSLAFLDVIACGFGAVVLLLLIVRPAVVDTSFAEQIIKLTAEISDATEAVLTLRQEWAEAQDEDRPEIDAPDENASEQLDKALATAEATLSGLRSDNEGLELVKETLKRASIKVSSDPMARDPEVGGIPVDSEYVIFIIDTSGSMDEIWSRVTDVMERILEIHPTVRGFQVLNDNGHYLYSNTRGGWIPDTRWNRDQVRNDLQYWADFSSSSPEEGLATALRTYAKRFDGISIYTLGDDFTGSSYDRVLDRVARANRDSNSGEPIARVHAIGFQSSYGSSRFATLMRAVVERNRGAFVGLP